MHNYFWLDLETTGLDEHKGALLEWAVALCADDAAGDMTIEHEWSGVIHHPASLGSRVPIDDYVLRMHTENGLWTDVEASTTTLAESDEFLHELCGEVSGRSDVRGIVLAGNSVHFDLRWCHVHLPRFAAHLSHRVFDVSTLKSAEANWGGDLDWPAADVHRALPDVRASIAAAKLWRDRRFPR